MIVDVEGKQTLIMKIMIVITDGTNNGWTIEGTKTRIVMVTTMTETIKLQITGKKAPTYNAILSPSETASKEVWSCSLFRVGCPTRWQKLQRSW